MDSDRVLLLVTLFMSLLAIVMWVSTYIGNGITHDDSGINTNVLGVRHRGGGRRRRR